MAKKKTRTKKTKTTKANQKKVVKTIDTATRALIVSLADVLSTFLPLNSRTKKAETFTTIFKESGKHGYIPKDIPKKRAMEAALIKLFRYHERLPYAIFRKIVTASVKYRQYQHNPLKREELDKLGELLSQLGFDLVNEFNAIDLDQFNATITVPPNELVKRLEDHSLYDEIKGEPLELFKNGHFNEAVRKATEKFEAVIQNRTRSTDIGKTLMNRTFKVNEPAIALNSLITGNEKSIQEGFQGLTAGMMQAMRNIFSHGDEDQRPAEEAYEMLLFINWLFRQLPG